MPERMWMVRAGRNAHWGDDLRSEGIVGLGWHEIGDSSRFSSKSAMLADMKRAYPEMGDGTAASGVSQLWRFQREISIGDDVVTYEIGTRLYHIGKIMSDARYEPVSVAELALRRSVDWVGAV